MANVSFKATYRDLRYFPIEQAGLTRMNTTMAQDSNFMYFGTGDFWWHFPSMATFGYPVKPVTCAGELCQANFYPGPMSLLKFDLTVNPVPKEDSSSASTFVLKNAPGYQIEFEPKNEKQEPALDTSIDCRAFGIFVVAVEICLRLNNDSSFSASILPATCC